MKGSFYVLASLASLPLSLAVSPFPNRVGSASLQCDVYALAGQFGVKIQPKMLEIQKKALIDALTLPDCNTSVEEVIQAYEFSTVQKAKVDNHKVIYKKASTGSSGPEFFVDPKLGDDANSGNISNPLKTIAAALTLTRKTTGTGPATITLREGKYYIGNTIKLTAADSFLTIQNYEDEVAELSGTRLIESTKLDWKLYKSSNSSTTMSLLEDTNLVYGATFEGNNTNIDYVGKTSDAKSCSDLCLSDPNCDGFTWHDPNQPAGEQQWDNMYVMYTLSNKIIYKKKIRQMVFNLSLFT